MKCTFYKWWPQQTMALSPGCKYSQRCTALHCTALHCTALHCTVLLCLVLNSNTWLCTALNCTTWQFWDCEFSLSCVKILVQSWWYIWEKKNQFIQSYTHIFIQAFVLLNYWNFLISRMNRQKGKAINLIFSPELLSENIGSFPSLRPWEHFAGIVYLGGCKTL